MRDSDASEHGGDGSQAQRGLFDREPEDVGEHNRATSLTRPRAPRKYRGRAAAQGANATAASGVATRKLKLSSTYRWTAPGSWLS
jgi:hypothetical protein